MTYYKIHSHPRGKYLHVRLLKNNAISTRDVPIGIEGVVTNNRPGAYLVKFPGYQLRHVFASQVHIIGRANFGGII